MRATSGGRGLLHPLVFGGGVGVASGVGAGAGVGVGVATGVAVGFGAGVPTTGIDGIATVRTPDGGVFVGCVGSSSVIVWQPVRKRAPSATPQAVRFIVTPSV
jgi:hypothetical protein